MKNVNNMKVTHTVKNVPMFFFTRYIFSVHLSAFYRSGVSKVMIWNTRFRF